MSEAIMKGVALIVISILAMMAHEHDIVNQCKKEGKAKETIWTTSASLKCEIVK